MFSLVLALVASPNGLTKSELFDSVYGYAQRSGSDTERKSAERQFERDKEQVRQLGIPIETIDSPQEPGNNQLTRYRITKDRLQLPTDLRFDSAELTVLRLAALAWSEGSLGSESRWASMKVASLGAGLDVRQLGIAPRLGIPESAAPALQRAITDGRVARFDYLLPTRERSHGRRVAPVRLHRAEGRWHLIAFDLERREYRVFLLSRITSEVRVSRDEFDVDLFDGVEETLVELQALADTQRAEVSVRRGSAAESRLAQRSSPRETSDGHDPGFVTLEIGTLDWHALAEELASFGGDVRVQAPPSLRRMVVEVLDLIRAQHLDGGTDA